MLRCADSTLCSALSTKCRKSETITRKIAELTQTRVSNHIYGNFTVYLLNSTAKFEGLCRKAAANPTITIRNKTDVVLATAKQEMQSRKLRIVKDRAKHISSIWKNEERGRVVSPIGHHWI
jgi:hypothetical protein